MSRQNCVCVYSDKNYINRNNIIKDIYKIIIVLIILYSKALEIFRVLLKLQFLCEQNGIS